MDSLKDKIVLISGGTQGVGGGIATAAVAAGATVVVTGRRVEQGEAFAATLGDEHSFVQSDVADPASAQAAVAAVIERHGRIDGLVNSAGLTTRGSVLDTSVELFDQHYAVNLRGPFLLMQAAIKDMLQRRSPGAIVNISTMSSHGGQPFLLPYSATKAGLVGLTRNLAHAHRWDRIRVNAINIGWTQTEGEDAIQREFHEAEDGWADRAASSLPMGRLGQVEEMADLAVLLLSDRSGVVTGSIIDWDQNVIGGLD